MPVRILLLSVCLIFIRFYESSIAFFVCMLAFGTAYLLEGFIIN